MKKADVFVIASIIVFILSLAYITALGGLGPLPPINVRRIAINYLNLTYNTFTPYLTVFALESVTSIVWDFRGLDTLYETAVFYAAIIASIALYRGVYMDFKKNTEKTGLSPIAKTVTRISLILIPTVAASVALHGHLTPGGGFQAGSIATVVIVLSIIIFSRYFLPIHGLSKNKALLFRSIGLLGIAITSIALLLIAIVLGVNAYIFQNQAKIDAPLSFPSLVDNYILGGSLLFFNLFEFIAVAFGFTIVFLLLSISEEKVKKVVMDG